MRYTIRSWADKVFQSMLQQVPFRVTHQDLQIQNLPQAFQGFSLVQVSDLHIDYWNRSIAEAAIDTINSLNADLIVCTGDTISNGKGYLGDLTHILSQLQARYGKLACLGNHDYSDGSGSYGVREALRKAGFDLLVNESTELTIQHQQIQLAGADDLILGRQCLKMTNRRLVNDKPVILLSHNPENFDAIACFKPNLVLSGHTHGGQIHLPSRVHQHFMGTTYIAGLYQKMSSLLYVNRGLGSAVFVHHWKDHRIALPTPRWAVQPEISFFRLVPPDFEESSFPNKKRSMKYQDTEVLAS